MLPRALLARLEENLPQLLGAEPRAPPEAPGLYRNMISRGLSPNPTASHAGAAGRALPCGSVAPAEGDARSWQQ